MIDLALLLCVGGLPGFLGAWALARLLVRNAYGRGPALAASLAFVTALVALCGGALVFAILAAPHGDALEVLAALVVAIGMGTNVVFAAAGAIVGYARAANPADPDAGEPDAR